MSSSCSITHVGKYELGKTLGEGAFGKVKFARNETAGEAFAVKILDKEKIINKNMIDQMKREITTMRLIKHPNVIRLYEVMASKRKIYMILEYANGGELFDRITTHGRRLKEDEARKYFQQLIYAVDYCHSRGVIHRDLKPENLLLDANGVLKVSDFGLSALSQQRQEDVLLHTRCGTPNYVAPEVIKNKGYDGAKADIWSCGVILFVLMAGYLPFEDANLMELLKKIAKAKFTCPPWISSNAKKLIKKILDPNPLTRITIPEILQNEWFKKGYMQSIIEQDEINLDDVDAIFDESGESGNLVVEWREKRPITMNAFDIISRSKYLNLDHLFYREMGIRETDRIFFSKFPAQDIVSKIEAGAMHLGFSVKKKEFKLKLRGEKPGRKGNVSIATEILEVASSLHLVVLSKTNGDSLEYLKFYEDLSTGLKDVVWRQLGEEVKETDGGGVAEQS